MTTGPYDLIHPDDTLADLAAAVHDCRGCGLWSDATQAVFGEGSPKAPVTLVGEQPGDVEDRDQVWMTNVVKHFRWKPGTHRQGKRRIHHTPAAEHIHACRPWLDAELERLRPDVLVCLGAVAAQTLIDKDFRVSQDRGKMMPGPYGNVLATVHPSSLLRAPDDKARLKARADFVADLQVVVRHLAGHARAASA
jgi:uracil-DNA glycosylase family 4